MLEINNVYYSLLPEEKCLEISSILKKPYQIEHSNNLPHHAAVFKMTYLEIRI